MDLEYLWQLSMKYVLEYLRNIYGKSIFMGIWEQCGGFYKILFSALDFNAVWQRWRQPATREIPTNDCDHWWNKNANQKQQIQGWRWDTRGHSDARMQNDQCRIEYIWMRSFRVDTQVICVSTKDGKAYSFSSFSPLEWQKYDVVFDMAGHWWLKMRSV